MGRRFYGKETMRGTEGGFGGKPPVPFAHILTVLASSDQPNWSFILIINVIIIIFVASGFTRSHSGHAGAKIRM